MLNWFARRLKEAQEKDNEKGFTLIELLVVVIIIGILAAIAIPTFLSQRTGANNATAQSDLRNTATAATSCASANNGSYATCNEVLLTSTYGMNESRNVDVVVTTTAPTQWVATARHTGGNTTYTFDTAVGEVTP